MQLRQYCLRFSLPFFQVDELQRVPECYRPQVDMMLRETIRRLWGRGPGPEDFALWQSLEERIDENDPGGELYLHICSDTHEHDVTVHDVARR